MNTTEFRDGFRIGAGLTSQSAADDHWAWFSRQLSDRERSDLEDGGYDAGLEQGTEFRLLYCHPMNEAAAREYVANHTDDDQHDEDTLEAVFCALAGREADDEDRAQGLWSLCCQLASQIS